MPSKTLGSVLAEARKKNDFSLREVAERVKKEDGEPISPQYLNDIEHDRRTPSSEVLRGLSRALKVSEDYLNFLAGMLPKDLKALSVNEETVDLAYSLFRKKLDDRR
jgi:transcriptional regulator with XRE-family HTH domain